MHPIPQNMFDVYGLSLPWGLGFVGAVPTSGWRTEDGESWGVVTFDEINGVFGCLVMRRRVDCVWVLTLDVSNLQDPEHAQKLVFEQLVEGAPREPLPSGTVRRPSIFRSGNKRTCALFQQLASDQRRMAAWMIAHLYYSLPKPDINWVRDFQTENLHTRLWELHLLACFREQGRFVTQDHPSPDFCLSNRSGESAWIEAVTTNPDVRYDHATTVAEPPPSLLEEKVIGPAAVRYAGTISNKLKARYQDLPHVVGKPFAIAIADFHAQGSMTWSRPALIAYLYGQYARTHEIDGQQEAMKIDVDHLLGEQLIAAGLFRQPEHSDLSAVIFSNGCSVSKFGRVLMSMTGDGNGFRATRVGDIFDRTPGALKGFEFCLDVTSQEYRDLWPQGYEPWSAELEVFHNPLASQPFSKELLPEATHWIDHGDEIRCEAYYETQILSSLTIIQRTSEPAVTLQALDELPTRGSLGGYIVDDSPDLP